jgi:transposase
MQNPTLQSLQLSALSAAYRLPVGATADCHRCPPARKKEISWSAVRYHFCKWSADGSLQRVWQQSIVTIKDELDLSQLNLDGSHALAKKGGEQVAYQARKRAKTSNILPMTEGNGYVVATTGIVAGNHHDAFDLTPQLASAFKSMKYLGLVIVGAFLNADSAFDTKAARRVCFNHQVIPNIARNARNQHKIKRGRKRLFNAAVYKQRFTSERTFAWIDKFRALLVRFDRLAPYFLGGHFLAYTLINLRHVLAQKA